MRYKEANKEIEMNELLKRMELLEKRVNELEKQLSVIKQMEQSERVKKYIDNVERARKVTSLLEKMDDNSTESVNVMIDKKVSEELRNEFDLNSLEDAHSYVDLRELLILEEEKRLNDIIDDKDWSGIFEYQKKQEGIVILRYIGFDEEEIVVPNKIEDMDVIEIGAGAFQNCKSIKKIDLPQSIKRIGDNAFQESGLVEINLPKAVSYLGSGAFYWTNIAHIVLPDNITEIMENTFRYCSELRTVKFSNNITKIGANAFMHCGILEKIDIPNACKEIGAEAFLGVGENRGTYSNKASINIRIGNNLKDIKNSFYPSRSVFGDNTRTEITVYCNAGSYAMEYARKHKISVKKYEEFEELD